MSSSHNSKFGLFINSSSLRLGLAMIVIAMVAPLNAQRSGVLSDSANTVPNTPGSALPPSMQDSVQVMVEMKTAPAAVAYAAALKVAQAQADAARNYALTHPQLKTSPRPF